MMAGGQPIIILKEGTTRERGRGAQSNNIMAARAIADAVRSTLGPKGMDKMLVDSMGDVVITNDGATILKEIDISHPAAKMVVEVAKSQDQECGDGTTTAVVLAGELLRRAEDLIEDVHPTLITKGYRLAEERALEILREIAIKASDDKTLEQVARVSMASKAASGYADQLAPIVVKAIRAVAEKRENGELKVDTDNVQIVKKHGGSVQETELVDGVIVDKERVHTGMPKRVENARVALVNVAFEIEKTEFDAKIEIRDPGQLQAFLDEEEGMIRSLVDKVVASGATVVFCEKGIDDLAQHFLSKKGVYAVRRAKKSDMEKLERATGGRIVSNLDDLSKDDLGKAGLVEERTIGEDKLTFVTGCPKARAVSILVRGGTQHVIDEVERTLDDALGATSTAFEDGLIVAGGGAPETEVAMKLRGYATKVGGREQLAIEAFAEAMEVIPRTLAENAGLDAIEILVDLRSAHEKGQTWAGVDVHAGKVADMKRQNVLEPLRVKTQALQSATEVATMILRIDDVIASKAPADAGKGGKGGPPGGGMGGDMDF